MLYLLFYRSESASVRPINTPLCAGKKCYINDILVHLYKPDFTMSLLWLPGNDYL